MRHLHIKPNSGSKNNVGSVSGTKVTSVSQKTGGTKRILGEPERSTKKRKLSENPAKKKASAAGKQPEADKTQKKGHGATAKRPCANPKKVKKSDGKSKKVTSKSDKKTNAVDKVLKRCKNSGKGEENEGPPTLCETFSRITTMVAETVINEKENQKLTESLMGKVKKEADSSKHKGESNGGDSVKQKKGSADAESFKSKSSGKKTTETSKKGKASTTAKPKMAKGKSEPKKSKSVSKKPKEKATLDNTENLVKVLKDEEMPLVFGKGIGTRRKSTAGFGEFETKPETSESTKSKNDVVPKAESSKKKVAAKKVVVKKEKPKPKVSESQLKKYSEEGKKSLEKGKEEPSNLKESSHKKVIPKKESAKEKQARVKKKADRGSPAPKGTKTPLKEAKSPKPKLGSETDGSNSDELTLSILQKKTKKTKIESEKSDISEKGTKGQSLEDVKPSPEERVADVEKNSSKFGKVKIKKEEKNEPTYKKILEMSKDKKKTKETESDTDEDMELRRIMAKKLRRVIKPEPEVKKKKAEPSKSVPESEQRARRLKLFGFWSGPKRHRVASLNAIAKVHCLYENESKGVLAEIEKLSQSAKSDVKKGEKKDEKMNKMEKKVLGSSSGKKSAKESERLDIVGVNKRILRGNLGNRGAGKHWDMFTGDSTTSLSSPSASSDEGHSDTEKSKEKKLPLQPSYRQKLLKKEDEEKEDIVKAPKRRRNNEIEVTMDLKDMVVRKRMASLNASAILAASYSTEKRSNRKDSSGTSTEDGMSSNEDNDRFLSDEGENTSSKVETKKPTNEQERAVEVKNKEEDGMNAPECTEYRHKKHFWKTKVESLKKSSREKRNSPSPILAEFGVKKDLSTTILEKEKNDKMNVDKEKDKSVKLSYPRKYLEGRMKGKVLEGKIKNVGKAGGKEPISEKDYRRKYSKRKLCDEDVKNINIEKVRGVEKSDEYEYKSDSDNGQRKLIELRNTGGSNKKVAVIVNQDTDVTITGVYVNSTRSTHHEGFCSIAGMQYRISSTSHTQTEATAVLKTSTASEQTPSPSEPRNCTSPRGHKSYTPLSALSNMQPPAGAPPHPHLPPPPHHHHHLCGMGQHRPPPDHYIGHGPISHQRPMSPLGRRHGCSSAFTAPHCSSHPAPGDPMSGASDGEGFGPPLPPHGYFQPAGPLIHHHSSSSAPPIKSQNSTTSDTSSATESQAPASANEEPAETAGRSAPETSAPAPPPPPAAHHMGYPRGYPPYQGGYYQGTYYPPPPQSAHFQPPPPSFHQHYHHHQDLCYPPGYPPASYPPHPGSYRRFLQPPPGYYSPELTYGGSGPPSSQDHGAQQMVVPGGASSSYSAPLDSYPPPTPYYPGYSPGPGPACYSHPPSSRNLAFIEQTYQSCPCPMQLCPKNVHIGPLTGECKRPGALPLPPVALQLPQEPPGAAGPPSPARGSAGMPPQPSPAASNSARPNWDAGRTSTKSAAETKWEESKTVLEFKPLKSNYKSEKLSGTEAKDLQNLSNVCNLMKKCAESADNKWIDLSYSKRDKEKETFSQGLLAISSKEMLLLTTKGPELPSSIVVGEDEKKIKTEAVIPSSDEVEVLKKRDVTSRKRNSRDDSPKRKKLIAKLEEILVNNLEENKNRKRMAETVREDYENKVRKIQKAASVDQKDENVCIDGRHVKKQHKHTNTKAKLLKDRNEAINRTEGFHQNGIKSSGKKEKVEELNGKVEADKIVNRRKSNQDRSDFFPEAEIRSVRKSKSCSPSRSKTRENSPVTQTKEGEETKKKFENARATAKPKVKLQDHSRITGKRKNCSGGSKSGKQVAVLPKVINKSKKSRSEYSVSVTSLKKLASKKGHSASPRTGLAPKWSNGWSWDSESFDAKVYLTNDEPPVIRKCYTAMRHVEGDVIHPKDCILLKAGPRRIDLPFVAKVAALWENPDDGEMMVSLLWYYRPEHTDQGRQPSDQQDEIFASRHKDINSVACIEDKCFVLTYNEYCRYRKKVKRVEEGVAEKNLPVPRLEQPYFRFQRQPPCVMAPDMVFFCRRVYDFRQKRLLKNPT